jgi:hypothetical protein
VQGKKLKKCLLTYCTVKGCSRAQPLRDGCVYGSINCAFYVIATIEFPQIIQSLSSIFTYKVSQSNFNLQVPPLFLHPAVVAEELLLEEYNDLISRRES